MKAFVNEIYMHPLPENFKNHMRNDLGFGEDHKKIIDSMSKHYGDSTFHYQDTMIPKRRYEYLLGIVVSRHMEELLRLAVIGYKYEQNTNESQARNEVR